MIKKTMSRSSSCFGPTTSPTAATTTNLTTCLYHTRLGIFALTWSRSFLGRSLHLHLLPTAPSSSSSSFRLSLSPFLFWNKRGSQTLPLSFSPFPATVLWDLSRSRFGSGPEPESGFSIAVSFEGDLVLSVGDLNPSPKLRLGSGSGSGSEQQKQALVVRREHVHGTKLHRTKTMFGGKTRSIEIECDDSDSDPKLVIRIDEVRVVQVKHLKWKFRGSQRIEVDGQPILLSWDVYNWLFEDQAEREGFALFTFRFEIERGDSEEAAEGRVVVTEEVPAERGWRKKKGLRMKARSASSSSLSSASSSACGSVLDWESVEETELKGPTGFSLLVYAWKS